ncbi:helix-turn-helix domain-containing protein [Streptomyces sediminimaris]|uniref:helix-turn-helix domain-containing protein n=1 Tax=Streptomyces sediminimaris TaxID=3383721 RepID=UPI0039995D9E
MKRTTRQIIVGHLADRGMNVADIASELGVSKETVRRDLHNAGHTGHLVLRLDAPLREALTVLRSVHDVPDTVAQNVHAARAAIRATADAVTDARTPVTTPVVRGVTARRDGP